MKRAILAAAMLCLLAAGCSGPPLRGTVKAKQTVPGHTTTDLMAMPDGGGGTTLIPVARHVPPAHYLHVQDGSGALHKVGVTEAAYEAAREGDRFGPAE